MLGTYHDITGKAGLLAANRGWAPSTQALCNTVTSGGTRVELCLEVLQVEGEVEDVSISNLQAHTES